MSTKYNVVWAGAAEKDLINIIEYIAEDSLQDALNTLTKIKKQTSNLYTFPERGRIVPELYDQGILLYRELIIAPWRLIYRISEQEIYVLSIIDSRRNVEDILMKRFVNMR
jgi:plasmid stabilization system protein ParE